MPVFTTIHQRGDPELTCGYIPYLMAYTVLARRYRSSTFDEVVGQAHVAQTIKRAIESGRIAHAYLFCGTRGTGKTSMARILAKALNCLAFDKPTTTPCGKCSSCLGIARGDDMDYVEIDAASNTQVDKTREAIIENVAYRPALCRFKIFLIDEVHMLSKGSFNALLKTLEEPPEHVKFILATTEPEKIPNTILSRCQRYDFKNIPTREVAGHLARIVKEEGLEAEEDALLMVARAGGGSMRDSLSLLDRLLSVGEKKLTLESIETLLGMPRGEQVAAMVEAMGGGNPADLLKKADEILSSGMSPDALIAGLTDHLHNVLLMKVCGAETGLVEVPGVTREMMKGQAAKMDSVILTQDIAILEELRRQLRSGSGGRALMDATLVRLALAEQFTAITTLLGEVDSSPSGEKKKYDPHHHPQLPQPHSPAVINPPVVTPAARPVTATLPAEAPAQAPVASAAPLPATPPPAPAEEEDDDLPRPGKVWDNSGPSLADMLKARSGGGSAPATPARPPVADNFEVVDEKRLPEIWKGVLEGFRKHQPGLYAVLQTTALGGVSDGQAIVEFDARGQFLARQVEKDDKREKVAAALSEALGAPVGVRIVVRKDDPAPIAQPIEEAKPKVARPTLKDIEDMARNVQPGALVSVAPAPTNAGANMIKVSEELIEQLKQDDLIRAVVEGLGGQIVKVVEE